MMNYWLMIIFLGWLYSRTTDTPIGRLIQTLLLELFELSAHAVIIIGIRLQPGLAYKKSTLIYAGQLNYSEIWYPKSRVETGKYFSRPRAGVVSSISNDGRHVLVL
jgi:hypothetical protein